MVTRYKMDTPDGIVTFETKKEILEYQMRTGFRGPIHEVKEDEGLIAYQELLDELP